MLLTAFVLCLFPQVSIDTWGLVGVSLLSYPDLTPVCSRICISMLF